MDESKAELRQRMFQAAVRMRKRRPTPPAPAGLTQAEVLAVMAIDRLEREGGRVRSGDVARCSHTTPSAISQTLKSLETKGLITRQRAEGDSRGVTVHLTDEGRAFNARGRQMHEQRIDDILDYLGPDDASEFVRILERLADFVEERHGDAPGAVSAACAATSAACGPAASAPQEGGTPCA